MRKVQRIACGPQPEARAEGSVGSACTAMEATSKRVTTCAGGTLVAMVFGMDGKDVGVGLPADISQQVLYPGTVAMLLGKACPSIIGQSEVQCSAVARCNQHAAAADAGIAKTTIANTRATSLKSRAICLP